MHLSQSISEDHDAASLDSDDNVPPVPPRLRTGKTMKEENQIFRPFGDSDIQNSTSAISTLAVVRKNPNIRHYHGNTLPPNMNAKEKYGDNTKHSSYTLPGKPNDKISKSKSFSPILNPKYSEDKFERATHRLDSLDNTGNTAHKTFIDDSYWSSPLWEKDDRGETSSNTHHVIPNQTMHSTDIIRMNRKKPIDIITEDRSVQEIASSFLWYHKNLDRSVAKHMLEKLSTNGAFLVRNASSSALPCHVYTLETYYEGKVYKFQISKEDGQLFFNGFPKRTFRTLEAMVEAMMTYGMDIQNELGECVHINLTLPWRICMENKADK
ncbi:hypothetical protein ACJMK2_005025 [Sinanodonta woodiana]|uniref:SH2 domain-containing protein n=1 Tax=Sinanodonta woodiana TaxID=1069815 RepID=A0ABD3VS80_SINWO